MSKYVVLLALVFAFVPAANADICSDISTISDGWDAVSTFLDENQEEGFSDEEVKDLGELVTALAEGTAALATGLTEAGNDDEKAMGKKLSGYMNKLSKVDGKDDVDYLVSIIDDMVATLDGVAEYCESAE